jgi:hypothetical protein
MVLQTPTCFSQKFSIGLKGGIMMNWAGFGEREQKDTFSTKPSFGCSGGFQIGFPLKKDFQVMLEGGFARKSRVLTFEDGLWVNRTVFNMADGSMLLRKTYHFYLKENVPSQWFFEVGPDVNYIITANGDVSYNEGEPYSYKVFFKDKSDNEFNRMFYTNANRWLFGLTLGVGFKAPLKNNRHITTQLRFISGHTHLGKRDGKSIFNLWDFHDTLLTNFKSVSVSLAYTLDFDVQQSRKGKSTLDKKMKKHR